VCKVGPAARQLVASHPIHAGDLQVLRSHAFEEQMYVIADLVQLNLMENKHICHFRTNSGRRKPSENAWLWATSKEELDIWDLGYKPPKDRKDC
jgi:hypothetical protein